MKTVQSMLEEANAAVRASAPTRPEAGGKPDVLS